MTIDEAIKTLEQECKDHHSFPTDIIGQAEGLGIEALKYVQEERKRFFHPTLNFLPGETKD